ncbi:MAG TPA: DEAD/DEAH box helicase [Thermoanaerobaculia bacterium]|nr:DEAD/DEAH box helicase [Thermoanaerobaculia bacterium]
MSSFSPATRAWFEAAFPVPTRIQRLGWPALTAGQHSLLVAPTGSGKTLAAFLWAIDRALLLPDDADAGVRVIYVSPLKALVYDVERNLHAPLVGIRRAAERAGQRLRSVGVDVRTGDTPQRERQRQVRRPAEILVTTPESLFLMLGSRAAATFRTVETVIVDEIHVFAPSKRGAHLTLSLERLAEITARDPQRIGLSATVRPLEDVARFLGGDRPVEVVDAGERPRLQLRISVPVPDMDDPGPPERGRPSQAAGAPGSEPGWPRGREVGGIWPRIVPRLLDLILEHRSTIVFVNSRGLCERLAQRLEDLWRERCGTPDDAAAAADAVGAGPVATLVRAHHGSVSHERRAEIEEALKAGRLRALVATSSLELGIDMGAVDLVVLVESPGSVARGLQRVGRAGHGVGETSRGVIFPKFKGDLLECAVVAERMLAGDLEPLAVPKNPLDVLAQQMAAACADEPRAVADLERLARRAYPFRDLTPELLRAVLEMLSGRYPSDELADLRPTLSWDRSRDVLEPRRGTRMLTLLNAGTIPDRGLFAVQLGADGPRLGELDEEMVYESRRGDTFLLGASTWRVADITRDRVIVEPAPGQPGRMPFWRGDGPGRPIELGRAVGAFVRELTDGKSTRASQRLTAGGILDELAARNLLEYLEEQRQATGVVPSDRTIVVERFRDELGDWRVCILSPFGSRVHAPWALALEVVLAQRAGFSVETLYTDDGIVLRFADTEELPSIGELMPGPEEVEDLVVEQLGDSALFASRFRENAARALLLPRRRARGRTPLWQQRLRAKNLLAAVRRFADFPIVLETYRECLRDVFDVPALVELLRGIQRREVRVEEVETASASPFARSLVFAYVAQYLYEQDAPLAERRAQALTLDRNLLRELLGEEELRDLLDPAAIAQVEQELQGLSEDRRSRDADELHDLLRRLGDLRLAELVARAVEHPGPWLERLREQRRAAPVRIAGEERWIAAEDAGRFRDALGTSPPRGLPDAFLARTDDALEGLVARFARSRGPFSTTELAERWSLEPAQLDAVLTQLERQGRLVHGEIRPGGSGREWCDTTVLRRLRRQTLGRLRGDVEPVDARVLGRFLPAWHGVVAAAGSTGRETTAALSATRLDAAIAQLEGLALPWSVLSRASLPLRVPGFRLEMLDLLAATGGLVWVGRGALGPSDGRIALYRRERAHLLLPPDGGGEPGVAWGPPHRAVLEHLEHRGACFTVELQLVEGLRALPFRELEAVLWDLVWAGTITNDTFLPLRTLGQSRGIQRPAAGAAPRLRAGRGASSRGLAGGRWSLVRSVVPVPADTTGHSTGHATARAHALASTLLERYGVVAREMALAEEIPGGFEAVYRVLSAMEEAGQVRRGYFVEGLAGRQFAQAGVVDRLRSLRVDDERPSSEDEAPLLLPALDPANPWGALLPWPELARDDGPRPRRAAGTWVALVAGEPVFLLEAGGRSLVTFRGLEVRGWSRALVDALLAIAGMERRRSLRLARIDGEPARTVPAAAALLELGCVVDGEGLRLAR